MTDGASGPRTQIARTQEHHPRTHYHLLPLADDALRPQPVKPIPNVGNRLSPEQRDAFLSVLRERFEKNPHRHPKLAWTEVHARLESRPDKLWSLAEMERTGGEPDVVGHDRQSGELVFFDCSDQSPAGRMGLCYDRAALTARREHKPRGCATDLAQEMGVEVMTEPQYFELQKLGEFDTKRSSWLQTPPEIRALGGAIFGDRRFGRVFIYHNGAESYYSSRGFRAVLRV